MEASTVSQIFRNIISLNDDESNTSGSGYSSKDISSVESFGRKSLIYKIY